jgi:hypothetical protein
MVNGVMQEPLHGVSMAYCFDDPAAAERHETQYFEMLCNRGIYHKGWTAVTKHRTPWKMIGSAGRLSDDRWELYDTTKDWSQAHDLAREMPDKLEALKRLFEIEAVKYNVLPLDARAIERANPELAGRPPAVKGNTQLLFGGMHRLQENAVINTKNHSHSVTAEIEVPDGGAEGVIIAQGGDFGGWALYAHEGRLRYCYNAVGIERYYVGTELPLPAGTHQARMEFAYDGGGLGKGATARLYVDGAMVGEDRIERTHKFFFSMDETMEIGRDAGAPVSEDYGPRDNAFTGAVNWIQIDVDDAAEDVDHLVGAEERFKLAMARQ